MLFLLNNPVIGFAVLAALGFMLIMGIKIANEVKLNNALNMKHMKMRIGSTGGSFAKRLSFLSAGALAPAAVLVMAFVVGFNIDSTPTREFQSVQSASDIMDLYESFNTKLDSGYRNFAFTPEMAVDDTLEAVDSADEGTGSDDYSETNNQVIGVDEMDNVLTDGKYIYTMYGTTVQITLAYTMENGIEVLELLHTFEYPNDYCSGDQFYPMGMFVDDERLIVIGNQYTYNCNENTDDSGEEYSDYWYGGNSSHIKVLVYDKTDDFSLEDEYLMNGYFTGTRKIGDSLYIVANNWIPFYYEDVNVEDYIPFYEVNDQKTTAKYEDIVYVEGTSPNAFTTFYGIDLDTTKVDMEVILGDSGYNLYVSNENMYLVGAVYYFFALAEVVDVEDPVQEQKTAIMRIAIDDASVEFNGVGYVEGNVLNQFSMDEYEGRLRITTTTGWWWGGGDINNRLWILDENLEVQSVLENLGKPGETIKSTRFVGDYAYLVTFEQTDPFYVINVSDPANPVVEGELEIPGFSTYLQPLGDDYMLGIGFDADSEGRVQGLKMSIYDISDKANPVIFDEVIFDYADFGWSWSSVVYNHKDLLVSLSKGIIAMPFSSWDYDEFTGNYTYNSGILVYNIDLETGFEYNGYVTHEEDSEYNVYVYKSKFISDYLYTVSNKYIKVSTIADSEVILKSVQIQEDNNYGDDYTDGDVEPQG